MNKKNLFGELKGLDVRERERERERERVGPTASLMQKSAKELK